MPSHLPVYLYVFLINPLCLFNEPFLKFICPQFWVLFYNPFHPVNCPEEVYGCGPCVRHDIADMVKLFYKFLALLRLYVNGAECNAHGCCNTYCRRTPYNHLPYGLCHIKEVHICPVDLLIWQKPLVYHYNHVVFPLDCLKHSLS